MRNKKRIALITILTVCGIVGGSVAFIYNNKGDSIKIFSGITSIPFISAKDNNAGDDLFVSLVSKSSNAPYLELESKINIAFEDETPDSIVIYDSVLNSGGESRYSVEPTQISCNLLSNSAEFDLVFNPVALLSSNSADYEKGAVIRGIKVICQYKKNTRAYAFIIRSDASINV